MEPIVRLVVGAVCLATGLAILVSGFVAAVVAWEALDGVLSPGVWWDAIRYWIVVSVCAFGLFFGLIAGSAIWDFAFARGIKRDDALAVGCSAALLPIGCAMLVFLATLISRFTNWGFWVCFALLVGAGALVTAVLSLRDAQRD